MELEEQCNVYVNESFDPAGEKIDNQVDLSVIKVNNVLSENSKVVEKKNVENYDESISYIETLMHLFKGNVGSGCFAMADAVKNGGLVLAPILTLFLGIICVHAQHMLLRCSAKMKQRYKLTKNPDYAETVELCFSSSEKWQKFATPMKTTCNVFICVTQLGFCCIYFLFIGTNLKQVLDFYGLNFNIQIIVTLALIPIWLSSLITNLKYLGEFFSGNF
jgi:solute carrier family 36 (proton-coupled amino acid transporter)